MEILRTGNESLKPCIEIDYQNSDFRNGFLIKWNCVCLVYCKNESLKPCIEIDNQNSNFRHDFLIKWNCVYCEIETVSFIVQTIWDTLPNDCKDATSLKSFKENRKIRIYENCSCRLSNTYI